MTNKKQNTNVVEAKLAVVPGAKECNIAIENFVEFIESIGMTKQSGVGLIMSTLYNNDARFIKLNDAVTSTQIADYKQSKTTASCIAWYRNRWIPGTHKYKASARNNNVDSEAKNELIAALQASKSVPEFLKPSLNRLSIQSLKQATEAYAVTIS